MGPSLMTRWGGVQAEVAFYIDQLIFSAIQCGVVERTKRASESIKCLLKIKGA